MAQPQMIIRRPSVASLYLEPTYRTAALGSATGFVVERNDQRFLVTNWHVVAGRRPDTLAISSPTGGIPDRLVIAHNVEGKLGAWQPIEERLYSPDGAPLWFEHPEYGRQVDVVALPLTREDGLGLYVHDLVMVPAFNMIEVGPSDDLSIIGFPYGQAAAGFVAVWTRATIASEPSIGVGGLPRFYVDARTRPGQSGSPALIYNAGRGFQGKGGGVLQISGLTEILMGVYSGRLNDQSDLGFVWTRSALEAVVDGGMRGSVPEPPVL